MKQRKVTRVGVAAPALSTSTEFIPSEVEGLGTGSVEVAAIRFIQT